MLKALLQHFSQDDSLLRFLPQETENAIKERPNPDSIDFTSLLCQKKWMAHIHYSWFHPSLKELPQESLPLFLSLFSSKQISGINKLFALSLSPKKLSFFTQLYLSSYLKQAMQPEDILPEELIPTSKMNSLLKMSQKQLLCLIDFLGLHDLAADLRQVVDQSMIKKVHATLTPAELKFLQKCSKQPSKWVSPKIGLTGWNGEKKSLSSLLHQRGLIRLAKAIVNEDQSYQWHLVRRFDTSRGRVIEKELQVGSESNLAAFFQDQIFDITKRFK
ncbi:MAG: hypothetical protein S4CHLAM45_11430 [Chlamydiales bacterium]|nr:hypothetical protein [Chlamydiales bacterium]MCH9619635.1 hypothetical protein [Chlamydiales bacterium]MCH9623241.1 hypothetical protein [Chlamydiales bacterium]